MLSHVLYVRPRLRTWAISSALFACTVILFSRATDYGFTNYDDPRYVTNNPNVQAGLTRAIIALAFGRGGRKGSCFKSSYL